MLELAVRMAVFMGSWVGLFYGGPGNLSDGGALKTSQFGEGTKKGDVIGMKLDLSDERPSWEANQPRESRNPIGIP